MPHARSHDASHDDSDDIENDEPDARTMRRRRATLELERANANANASASARDDDDDDDDEDEDDDDVIRWRESGWNELRESEFDLYRELGVVKRANGDVPGGASRARSAFHRRSVKRHPTRVASRDAEIHGVYGSTASMNGFCDSCECVLQFHRWFHARDASDRGRDFCAGCVETSRRSIPGREWDRKYNTPPLVSEGEYVVVRTLASVEPAETRARYESEPGSDITKASSWCAQFQRLVVAFSVFKDAEKFRIYRDHGFVGLVKSEAYAEDDVFDLDPFAVYDSFFAGDDPEDREYLLLNGAEPESDSEPPSDVAETLIAKEQARARSNASQSQSDSETDDSDDEVEAMLTRERSSACAEFPKKRALDDDDFPTPSVAARIASTALDCDGAPNHTSRGVHEDVWSSFAARFPSGASPASL